MKYRTILADPPWLERGAGKSKRGADKHYSLMKTAEIIDMKHWVNMITEPDCHLYLWVTNNFLQDGLAVMKEWGFTYITTITWVKMEKFDELFPDLKTLFKLQVPGLGQYFRGVTEHCLFGRKGNIPTPEHKAKTAILAPRRAHSEKPPDIYTYAEMVSQPPRLEVFGRRKQDGWDIWGDTPWIDSNEDWKQCLTKQ